MTRKEEWEGKEKKKKKKKNKKCEKEEGKVPDEKKSKEHLRCNASEMRMASTDRSLWTEGVPLL
jgi:hypothetical protein